MTKEEHARKEEELLNKINKVLQWAETADFISKSAHNESANLLYSVCMENKINFLPVIIEHHRTKSACARMINEMIDFAMSHPDFVKELSQEEIYSMITIPPGSFPAATKILTTSFKQLKALGLLENQEERKKAAKTLFKTILEYNNLKKTQEKLAKIWGKIGDLREIEDFLPAISSNTEGCAIEERKIYEIVIDCDKIGCSLNSVTDQKKVTTAFNLILRSFKEMEKKHSIMIDGRTFGNKIKVIFENGEMAKIFKLLIDYFSKDVHSLIDWTQAKGYKEFDSFFKKTYSRIALNSELNEKLNLNEFGEKAIPKMKV